MISLTRPMLAASLLPPEVEHDDNTVYEAMKRLKYPVIATVKKDGIRALRTSNLVSRTLKLIPNDKIRARSAILPYGFDMELWSPTRSFNEIQSIVMSEEHEESDYIEFHILDSFVYEMGYLDRLRQMYYDFNSCCSHIIVVGYVICNSPKDLFEYEKQVISEQGEGICFRTPDSPYKQGRSTLKEQYLVKLSRYTRSECTIIDFYEAQLNSNPEKRNATGLMKRQTLKAGMIGKDTLGAFLCRDSQSREFNVGCGTLSASERQEIWDNQETYMNKQITIKHKLCGEKILPRSPSFVGFREEGY